MQKCYPQGLFHAFAHLMDIPRQPLLGVGLAACSLGFPQVLAWALWTVLRGCASGAGGLAQAHDRKAGKDHFKREYGKV